MKKLVLFFLTTLCAIADKTTPEYWLGRLNSPDFEIRQEAMKKIWEFGDAALPLLKEFVDDDNPELAVRVAAVRRKVMMGVNPETPLKVVEMIEVYFKSTLSGKKKAIQKLAGLEAHDYLLRLHRLEENPELKEILENQVQQALPGMMQKALAEGNHARLRELMHLGERPNQLTRCGFYLDQLGELDAEISRLREKDDRLSRLRYLAYLRVKGDLPFLVQEAERLKDPITTISTKLLLGDPLPALEYLAQRRENTGSDHAYLQWSLANVRGDGKRAEEALASLLEDSDKKKVEMHLYRMGMPELAQLWQGKEGWEGKYDYLFNRDLIHEIPAALGVGDQGVSDEWLEEKKSLIENEEKEIESRATMQLMIITARFFKDRGLFDEEAKIYGAFFDALRARPDHSLHDWLQGYRYRSSLLSVGGAKALAREVDEFEVEMEALLRSFFADNEATAWLMSELRQFDQDLSSEDLLKLIYSFSGALCIEEKLFEKWHARLTRKVKEEYFGDGDDFGVRMLAKFSRDAGRAVEVLELSLVKGEPANLELAAVFERAFYASCLGEWKEARLAYEEYLGRKKNGFESYFPLSFVLRNEDRLEEADLFFEKALQYVNCGGQGAGSTYYAAGFYQTRFGDDDAAARSYQRAFLNIDQLVLGKNIGPEQTNIIEKIVTEAFRRRDWRTAYAFQELYVWQMGYSSGKWHLNDRVKAELARGMLRFQEGKRDEAEMILTQAHALIPGSGLLADDFFPVLREAGLTELHDTLCRESLAILRTSIETYPNDANARNTFAWVASRAVRELDEAEGHIKVAVELEPRSEAYLDTMAEVYFARRNREEAIKWSRRSFENKSIDPQLRAQYRRFRFGEFPVK